MVSPSKLFSFMQGASINKDSNYNIWERLGNTGEEEFLEFLRSGTKGETGNSAYQDWLNQDGNSGKTFSEFIGSFIGEDGKSAYEVWKEVAGDDKTVDDFMIFIKGCTGDDGDTGAKGETGKDGIFPDGMTSLTMVDKSTGNPCTVTISNGKFVISNNS